MGLLAPGQDAVSRRLGACDCYDDEKGQDGLAIREETKLVKPTARACVVG